MVSVRGALNRIVGLGRPARPSLQNNFGPFQGLYERIEGSGLFDPEVYLAQQDDVRNARLDPWGHFLRHGMDEGRHFTSAESVARVIARVQCEFPPARDAFVLAASETRQATDQAGAKLRNRNAKIGVFCSSEGNFYMLEIAELLCAGLRDSGIEAALRDERSSREEAFDIRIFVAPHEFFFLGKGGAWREFVERPNTVLYNVEQMQTQWFCRAFTLLLQAPLILDINFHTAQILQKSAHAAVFFMPGHLQQSPYTQPVSDISHIELVRGYRFSKEIYDWRERDSLDDRSIDVLFTGARTPHRDRSLGYLDSIADVCRFVCVYRDAAKPFTAGDPKGAASEANWALSQRAKIVLNLHRDWIGYFEWSRMVLRGIWQGACVVTDRGLPNPVFEAGVHYLEESPRHLGELIKWLLLTEEGREKLDSTRRAGFQRALTCGSMRVGLAPVLDAFERLLDL